MKHTTVSSSNVHSYQYDSEKKILEIAFKSGHKGQYAGVPQEEVNKLISAASFGGHLHKHIKPKYKYTPL